MTCEIKANAVLSKPFKAEAQFGRIVEVPVGADKYEGEYTITAPSTDDLIISTKDKLMMGDVTVEANHEIEDALIQNTAMDEYVNDRVTEITKGFLFAQTNIKKIYLPNVTILNGQQCFNGFNTSLLEEVHIPKWQNGGGYAFFDSNPNLRLIDYGQQPFTYMRSCPNLRILILRRTLIVSIGSSSAFTNTPLHPDGDGCYIYVPLTLLEQYRTNANWQRLANVLEFRPIEGSEYELEE